MFDDDVLKPVKAKETIGWREVWAQGKCNLATRLAAGNCNGTYAEGAIILCAAISALASDVWPQSNGEKRRDKARFVEALVTFAPADSGVRKISLPRLVPQLLKKKLTREVSILDDLLSQLPLDRVLTGRDCDKDELEILSICPSLNAQDIRRCSYASLLYSEVRSAYAHEYRPGHGASEHKMSQDNSAIVSYVNLLDQHRQIHFHLPWLVGTTVAVARGIDKSKVNGVVERAPPAAWWIDGGS